MTLCDVTSAGVGMDDLLRLRVQQERKLRFGSQRKAATAAGISNQTWAAYESGYIDVTRSDKIRRGVAKAFGWPLDWPENPPPPTPVGREDEIAELREHVARLAREQSTMAAKLRALDARTRPESGQGPHGSSQGMN